VGGEIQRQFKVLDQYSVKYSFENGLLSPQLRVAMGYLTGIGLIISALFISRPRHVVTIETFCATGTLILYGSIFASHSIYRFIGPTLVFFLMALVTATAFSLAVRLNAQAVAVLGLLGGFLTPPLLSTGVDRPWALFGYIALLDVGLLAVALRKRWAYLGLLAAASTLVIEAGRVVKFFETSKVYTGYVIKIRFRLGPCQRFNRGGFLVGASPCCCRTSLCTGQTSTQTGSMMTISRWLRFFQRQQDKPASWRSTPPFLAPCKTAPTKSPFETAALYNCRALVNPSEGRPASSGEP
jgi:hypothetical protein